VQDGAKVAVGPAATGAAVLVRVAVALATIARVAVRVGVDGADDVTVAKGVTVAGSGVVVTGTKTMKGVCVNARVGCAELLGRMPQLVTANAAIPNTKPKIRLESFTISP